MKYIVTNFAYGTGPYLRTTELAIALNNELKSRGRERMGIIVPWVYGEKQKRIMLEEFGSYEASHPAEILLDAKLGAILKSIFYGDNTYEEALRLLVENFDRVSNQAHEHLSRAVSVEDLDGNLHEVKGHDIVLELNHVPRVAYRIASAFSVAFGYISEILRGVLEVEIEKIAVNRDLVRRAILLADKIESAQSFHALAEPGTFSYKKDRIPVYSDEVLIPPTITLPAPNQEKIDEGIYVTITGISGLERLYEEARKLGLKLYSNDPQSVVGSEYLSPHYISNPNIKLQFARSGWGSVWLSQIFGTPLIAPDFDSKDDPEIYFNNICIEKLGLGVIYRGQSLAEIIREAEILKPKIQAFNQGLLARFGTLNGNEHVAWHIAEAMQK